VVELTDEGRARRGTALTGTGWAGIVIVIAAAAFALPFAIMSAIFLSTDVNCETDIGWTDAMIPIGVFAILTAATGTGIGVWTSIRRPSLAGVATIGLGLGLIALAIVLSAYNFQHTPLEFC